MFLSRCCSQLFFIFTLLFIQSAWSQSSDPLIINYCVDPIWAPYESTKNAQHIGISKQYIDIIQQKSPLTFNLIPVKNWQQALAFVKKGECQLLPMLNKSPQRDKFLTFTDIYFRAPNALYGHYNQKMLGNLSAISTQTVAVVAGYRMHGYLKSTFPKMNIIAVKNEQEGLTRVEKKEIDYFVGSFYSANKIIQDALLTNLRIAGIAEIEDNLRIGVNKQSEYLLPYLNKAIAELTDQDHQNVFSYFKVLNTVKHTDYSFARRIAIFCGMIIIVLLAGYWRSIHYSNKLKIKNLALKKLHTQLDEKNKQLAELAIRDPLTNLYNRSHLSEVISQQINLKNRYNKSACLLICLSAPKNIIKKA
jgi:ABC-type amino acid transport substrate-binding protein